MIYQVGEMIRDVRVVMEMNRCDTPLIAEGDIESLGLDELILSKLAEGARHVELEAPLHLLDGGVELEEETFIDDQGRGYLVLPEDFLRLVSFRMSDWERSVHEAIEESDPRYAHQSSRFAGIRGNRERPVVAIIMRSEGKVLEFYSCRDRDAWITQGRYIREPRIDDSGGIEISEGCYRAAVYCVGGLVLSSYGDERSGTLLEISKRILGID